MSAPALNSPLDPYRTALVTSSETSSSVTGM